MRTPTLFKILDAAAATITSDPVNIENAEKITFEFTREAHTSGSGLFSVTVSVDGINYVTSNKLIDNVTNTNAQAITRVASVTLSSNTSKQYSLDLSQDAFRFMKIVYTKTTDGTATVKALGLFNY